MATRKKPTIDDYKNRLDSPIGIKRIPAPKPKKKKG